MAYANYTSETVGSKGEELYRQQLRAKVEPQHKGRFLALDIETGDYEIDDDELTSMTSLLEKRPVAVIYSLRIGARSVHRIGFRISAPTS